VQNGGAIALGTQDNVETVDEGGALAVSFALFVANEALLVMGEDEPHGVSVGHISPRVYHRLY
jgi:hypothetical protein